MRAKVIKTNIQSLLSLFFPMRCIGCDSVIEPTDLLCPNCQFNLAYTNFPWTQENLMFEQLNELCNIEKATALLYFRKGNSTQQLLHHLKYKRRQQIGLSMAKLLLSQIEAEEFNTIDVIIPVPIHPKKLKQRGYNQIMRFAETLSTELNIPLNTSVLARIKNNQSQVTKNRQERLKTLKYSFELHHLDSVKNKHILLVDDVMTTGATLSICANLLIKQANVKVSVITIAFV